MSSSPPLHVVSVSLGSSTRDKKVVESFGGQQVIIERRGTDGDMQRAVQMIGELDGHVDAIGLGGIDLYLIANGKKYTIRDARRLARAAKITPIVDGSGLKHTLERHTLQWLQQNGVVDFRDKKVLLVSAVDRFGMAETLPELGAKTIYGDLIFALGIPYAIKTLAGLRLIARLFLPLICQVPFTMIYPTGEKQRETITKYQRYFDWADIIAGDFHFIRRFMPASLQGKVIITNTTTPDDLLLFQQRHASMLISTTPQLDGRSFGTNVMEGVIVALTKMRPEDMTEQDYLTTLEQLGWTPNVIHFNAE